MGTDLHGPIVEVGITWSKPGEPAKDTPDWWRQLLIYNWQDRNYLFFNVLAGVRGDDFNVIPARGIPQGCYSVIDPDVKEENQEGVWLGDHSFTWITPEEWEQVVIAYRASVAHENSGYSPDTQDIRNVDHILQMVREEKHVRLIFGFDS